MNRAIFSEAASRDVERIWLHIAADHFDAAERWNDQIRAMADRLATESNILKGHRRPDVHDPALQCWTEGSYVIVYRRLGDELEVARVLHGARNFEDIDWS